MGVEGTALGLESATGEHSVLGEEVSGADDVDRASTSVTWEVLVGLLGGRT